MLGEWNLRSATYPAATLALRCLSSNEAQAAVATRCHNFAHLFAFARSMSDMEIYRQPSSSWAVREGQSRYNCADASTAAMGHPRLGDCSLGSTVDVCRHCVVEATGSGFAEQFGVDWRQYPGHRVLLLVASLRRSKYHSVGTTPRQCLVL